MKKTIIFVVLAVALVSFAVYTKRAEKSSVNELEAPGPHSVDIVYSDSGYSPSSVKIKKGYAVVFKNESSKMMWTASAFHPSHKAYPGTDIEKCGIQMVMFDACKGFGPGESWVFRFNEVGTWKYHNHLEPKHFGTIIVE